MFGFLKRLLLQTDSTPSTVDPWALSEDEQLIDDVGVYTYDALEHVKVDIKRRKFIWNGGKKLSIDEVAVRLHQAKPDMPLELIENDVMEWLGEASMPEDLADGDEEERWQNQIEAWVDSHAEKRESSVYG